MDAVELGYPVDIPKLMGSEGFGRARVTVNEVNAAACESNTCVSILVNTSIERCSTLLRTKDVTSTVNNLEPASWDKIPEEAELCKPPIQVEELLEQLHSRGTNYPSSSSRPEVVHVERKARKVSRSSTGCSKRPRLAQLEDNMCSDGVDEVNNMYDNLGPKCNSIEKTQMVKQKNNSCGKRGDKRNFKVPMKAKYDSFSMKAGLATFGSAAGGNNFFGIYGLKSDFYDITKRVDDWSLKDLLDGTYECPSLGKDKGEKTANSNENFINSVRKACTMLPLAKPARSQNFAEMDSGTNKKLPLCPPSSISLSSTGDNGEKGGCTTNLSSCDKESCSKPDLLDFSLYQPKDILRRLALPPAKDLDALLLDAAKPSVPSRTNSDIRSGKQVHRRASLPPFPWSHTFSGHCKTNSDAVKLLTSRSTCHGRWARIGTKMTSHGASTGCFTNLESLTYDQSLVPISTSISHPWCDWESSSLATCSKASVNLESRINQEDQVKAEHCPRVLAAAQTLCGIATQFLKIPPPDGIMKWPKKTSQKAVKARKTKLFEKHEVFTTQISLLASESPVGIDQISTSKRRKLSMIENGKDLNRINGIKKGPINWSTPRSSRSSPNKTVTDKIAGSRHSTADISRPSCIMPSPAKILDKACNRQQKLQKIMATNWDRGRDRVD